MNDRLPVLAALLLLAGCATSSTSGAPRPTWAAPPLERAVSIRDGRTGAELSLPGLLDTLARADVVFLGETHTDETTHRVELAVYEGLLARRDGDVVLAMEMFERDVQQHLDAYLAGTIDEATFLGQARPWKNYATAYRPLVERARAGGHPVVASNFPRPLRRRVASEGAGLLDTLQGAAARQAPAELLPNTAAYWRRVDNAIRGHVGMLGAAADDPQRRLTSTQSLWDNAMGEACARALDEHPGDVVLHVNGGFHSAYRDGTVHQLRLRRPDARVATVAITPVPNPQVAELRGAPVADYVVFAEARATDVHDGAWSVWVPRELEYRLHLPEGASEADPVPLLLWLGDDGLRAEDGLDLWKDRLGDDVALAVLEAPTLETLPDLSLGGRWFRADDFSGDIAALLRAVERIWAYLLRHQPVDAERVVLAGEGAGATVVAAVALLSDRLAARALAIAPRRYSKIKDFPLPLPELRGDDPPPETSLRVVVGPEDEAWWETELAEYAAIGWEADQVAAANDPWQTESQRENELRSALGLAPRPPGETTPRFYAHPPSDSPRAHHWARLFALQYAALRDAPVAVLDEPPDTGGALPLPLAVDPQDFAGDALPLCPGPFGGTTVVVARPPELEEWLAIEQDDPLNQRSRFHRLRIATAQGERALPTVLSRLLEEGRTNVLVVPAVFCADAAAMRDLERDVRALADQLTLHWLPGLGGQLPPAAAQRD